MREVEIAVKDLFTQDKYNELNREQQFDLAISEGLVYNILRGVWIKKGESLESKNTNIRDWY